MIRLLIIVFTILSFNYLKAQTNMVQGLSYYQLRAEVHHELKVDSVNLNIAISAFTAALKSEDDEKATEFLLKSYYYKAAFIVRTKEEQKKNYQIATLIGEQAIKNYPKNEAILLWYIANYTKYGESLGVMFAVKNGLADKVKLLTEKLMEINPKYNDGAAYKILGVLNYKVPHIPMIISWPCKEKAEQYLKKALAVNSRSISNLYFYAEFLSEVKRVEEAKIILTKIVFAIPRKTHLIEDLYDISQANKLLDKLKHGR